MSQCSLDSPVLSHLKMHVDLCQARDEACYNLVSFKDGIHEIKCYSMHRGESTLLVSSGVMTLLGL